MIPKLEDALRMADGISWEDFDKIGGGGGVDEAKRKQVQAERNALAGAAARVAMSDDGRRIFKMLADVTLFRPVFVTQFGVDPMQAYSHGAFREGQNAIIGQLFKLAVEGGALELEPPAPATKAKRKETRE